MKEKEKLNMNVNLNNKPGVLNFTYYQGELRVNGRKIDFITLCNENKIDPEPDTPETINFPNNNITEITALNHYDGIYSEHTDPAIIN